MRRHRLQQRPGEPGEEAGPRLSDSRAIAALALDEWAEALPQGDAALLDPLAGIPLRWIPEQGWLEPVE